MVAVDSAADVSARTPTLLAPAAPLRPVGVEPSTDVAMSSSRDVAASSLELCQHSSRCCAALGNGPLDESGQVVHPAICLLWGRR